MAQQNNNNNNNNARMGRRTSLPAIRKRSDPGRTTPNFRIKPSHSRSPVLSKKTSLSPDGSVSSLGGGQSTKTRFSSGGSGGVPAMEDSDFLDAGSSPMIVLTSDSTAVSENGKSPEMGTDDVDGPSIADVKARKANVDMYKVKLEKVQKLITQEHNSKENNVNAYLRQAPNVDEQQRQKMKIAFEKQNQKSGQAINALQKKSEIYQKKIDELERPGSHKSHRLGGLRDVGQGIKGVVGNIKGAKDTIVAKPRELAHIIKNKFGSTDNINSTTVLKIDENDDEIERHGSIRLSDDDSSVTSGSGFMLPEGSPHSVSQNAALTAANEMLVDEITKHREYKLKINDRLQRMFDDLESYKTHQAEAQSEISQLKTIIEEERFRYGNLEDQLNDLTELHQHEITNLRQEIASATEKIEYQLDERIHDTQDILENCSTRVTKMELHQQQQQIISIEGVDNVTFRTLLTKLLNVVLAVVAVILVFVSTISNVLSPFLKNRVRILTTIVMITIAVFVWKYWDRIIQHLREQYNLPYYIL